jgi:hypothetical protein
LFQLVVLCFCTTPGSGSVVVFFCTTAPLPQVVVELCDPGAGVVVVVCDDDAGAAAGAGITMAGGDSTFLLKHPATNNAADAAMVGIKIRCRPITTLLE